MGTYRSPYGDTTYTKVFVGGLAWETPTEKMRDYFDQFGDILEAVIITDRFTGKSKGYGFVTYKDPEAARRACEDPNPMIDGRRANCNIASFGRPKPSPPRGKIQGGSVQAGPSQASSSSSYGGMPPPQHTLPSPFYYSPYGYPTYPPYGYAQGVYNQQVQQAQQYYAAQYYGNVVPSPNTYTSSAVNPYYYGYTRGGLPTTPAHGMNVGPSYVYYPTAQIERPTSFPPLISSSSSATRLYPPSPSEPRDQRSTATDTEAGGANWKAPIT